MHGVVSTLPKNSQFLNTFLFTASRFRPSISKICVILSAQCAPEAAKTTTKATARANATPSAKRSLAPSTETPHGA